MVRIGVTGGAGFIGSNLTARLLAEGHQVVVLDDLSRSHADENIAWLRSRFGAGSFELHRADLGDRGAVEAALDGCERIFHLGGQVAVTTSVLDPMLDFAANALGTLHVLEAARASSHDPIVVFASTNKVYGDLGHEPVSSGSRYELPDLPGGVPETQPLDFATPYGCSKGAADQYIADYHRTYGVRTVVLRQSCIYGPRQFGGEDQGWVAWLVLAALRGDPITIYGDGRQVRDVLFIDDLLDCYAATVANIDVIAGQVFNIGGGPANTISVWAEFGPLIEELVGHPVAVTHGEWRPGDQRVYVSDIAKAQDLLQWQPRVGVHEGIRRLADWIRDDSGLLRAGDG